MKYPLRALAAAFACSLGLDSCGGDDRQDSQILVEFYESPEARRPSSMAVLKPGLKIQNNDQSVREVLVGESALYLPDWVGIDSKFNVKIVSQPAGVTCTPRNNSNSGTVGLFGITVMFNCITQDHAIKGTINGLTASGLELNNGSDRLTNIVAGTTSFTMANRVKQTLPYGITVLTQPTGQTCTVVNGAGTVVESDITNVVVNCVNNS
jgi:hypothetical protein